MNVEVLLSSYNGEKFIKEQIDSILRQDIPVNLTVRDDGSFDKTVNIIKQYEHVSLIEGKNIGSTNSFLSLVETSKQADYYAFSDQDDVWDEDKIRVAIEYLKKYTDIPALYSSNTRLVDSNLVLIKKENKNPIISLGSALAKNYVTGCTVVFNDALMKYLKKYKPKDIPYHDWWINLVCLSIGGVSVFDTDCHMSYRQHETNVVGGAENIYKKYKSRLITFLFKKYNRPKMAKQIIDNFYIATEKQKILLDCVKGNIIFDKRFATGCFVDDLLFNICAFLRRL